MNEHKKGFFIFIISAILLFIIFGCDKKNVENTNMNIDVDTENVTEKNIYDSIEEYKRCEENYTPGYEKYLETISKPGDKNIINQEVNETEKSCEDKTAEVEYDIYKKIDFSNYIRNEDNGTCIDPIENEYINTPCRVTIKANVKIEKGAGLPDEDINDSLEICLNFYPLFPVIRYADYGDDFFDTFHEIEYSQDFMTGKDGKDYILNPSVGINILKGTSGFQERYVYHNATEYVGEYLTQDETQCKIRFTIKDAYYKINKLN